MLKIIWLVLNLLLVILILIRTPNNAGLDSFATNSNLLGSPTSTEKFLNNMTWFLIVSYFVLAMRFNFSI